MSVKPLQRSEIQGFSKGLATDLNPLSGNIGTTVAEANFELHRDETRSRRLGLNKELLGIDFPTGVDWDHLKLSATSTYLWEGADGNPNNKFIVAQIANVLRFFRQANTSSELVLLKTLTLPEVASTATLKFGNVEGYLGIVNGTPNIGLIEYVENPVDFIYSTFRIRIRDQFGIEETLNTNYEIDKAYRGPLNWQHYYNLYNQGWAIPRKDWVFGDPAPVDSVYLGADKQVNTKSPSNADSVWSGLANKPVEDMSLEHFEGFHYRQFEAITGADTAISRGYYTIDAFNRGSSRLSAWIQHKNKYPQTGNLVTGFNPPEDATTGGPTSIGAFAGRLFYSGCRGTVSGGDERSPNFNNHVFFTQLVRSKPDFSKCYQEGDPTSRESSDVVDTDGGFFVVSEATNIHTMYAMNDKLFLIAENGVWSVTGGSGYGFAATNYKVEKISTYGGIPNRSFIEFGGTGYFWGWDGIYVIGKNQYGDSTVENMSKEIIDKFYTSIDDGSKQTCQAFVDKARRQIRWVYTEGTLFEDGVSKELIFDVKFQAFYPFTIARHPLNQAYLLAGIQLGDFAIRYVEDSVSVGNEDVFAGAEQVLSNASLNYALDSTVKYLTARQVGDQLVLNFCEYNNVNYEDWEFTGQAADAYAFMETNAFTGGDFAVKKQVPYLVMAFAETEKTLLSDDSIFQQSSCLGRFMWNFTHLARSGKWGRDQQLYRKSRFYYDESDIDNGFSLNITKTKIRGIGRSFALHVETEPKKDCHIYGWNLSLTGNGVA